MRQHQEGITPGAEAVMVGPVGDHKHFAVQAEERRIQVAVRGQMDGIAPIEAVVITYRWQPDQGWRFVLLETLVQSMSGNLRAGTSLGNDDFRTLGPALGWAWDVVTDNRPRG